MDPQSEVQVQAAASKHRRSGNYWRQFQQKLLEQ